MLRPSLGIWLRLRLRLRLRLCFSHAIVALALSLEHWHWHWHWHYCHLHPFALALAFGSRSVRSGLPLCPHRRRIKSAQEVMFCTILHCTGLYLLCLPRLLHCPVLYSVVLGYTYCLCTCCACCTGIYLLAAFAFAMLAVLGYTYSSPLHLPCSLY